MGQRLRGATFVIVAVAGVVMLGGCARGRSAAQKAYLVRQSGSLGRCSLGEGGDFGGPFRPMSVASWNGMNRDVRAWARVAEWRVSSAPKDPPGDFTVQVKARFDVLRGDRNVVGRSVGAHQQDAKSIAAALGAGLDVFVGIRLSAGKPYAAPALALDRAGKVAWLGECAHRVSDSAAVGLKRADVDPARFGPAVRRWISDGDADALVRSLTRQ
jgi:hypothetical protein